MTENHRRPKAESPFARILNKLLTEQKVSYREAARIGGVSSSTITDWTSGTQPTNYLAVKKIADALGVSFCYLLTGIDDTIIAPASPETPAPTEETQP